MAPHLSRKTVDRSASMGATEDQVDMRDTVPQRINNTGFKIEDDAGTGEPDAQGG